MEEIVIKRLKKNKSELLKLYKLIKKNIDMETEMVDSDSLQMLSLVSKIDEELTDIIYILLDNKNSQN